MLAGTFPGRRCRRRALRWRIARPDGGYAFSALGNHGQFIFVDPAKKLIIVCTGERYEIRAFAWLEVLSHLADELDGRP